MKVLCFTLRIVHGNCIYVKSFSAEPYPAEVVIHPSQTTSTVAGTTTVLTCVGYGVPVPSVNWSRNGTILSNSSQILIHTKLSVEDDSGVTYVHSVLTLCNTKLSAAGSYSCISDNGLGNDSFIFELHVEATKGWSFFTLLPEWRGRCMVAYTIS